MHSATFPFVTTHFWVSGSRFIELQCKLRRSLGARYCFSANTNTRFPKSSSCISLNSALFCCVHRCYFCSYASASVRTSPVQMKAIFFHCDLARQLGLASEPQHFRDRGFWASFEGCFTFRAQFPRVDVVVVFFETITKFLLVVGVFHFRGQSRALLEVRRGCGDRQIVQVFTLHS